MADRCNVCHSIIGTWIDDPIKTLVGLAGEEFKGLTPIRCAHMIEIRNRINDTENSIGLTPTEWIEEIAIATPIRYSHIIECRNAIENILGCTGLTSTERAEILKQYFNYDEEGTHYGTEDREEWIDLNLDTTTPTRAIHMEDLRRPNIIMSIRWEQSCWESWDLTGIVPLYPIMTTHDHPIKPLSLLKHRWAVWQDYQEYEIDEGPERFKKIATGTAHSEGGTGSMSAQIYEQVSLISNPGISETRFSSAATGEAHFSKGTTGGSLFVVPRERKFLKTGAKVRFIWSGDCTTYEKDSLSGGLPGYLWYEDWEIWGAAMIQFSFVHPYYGGHTITYGIGPSASEGSWIEAPIDFWVTSGDIVRDIYSDYSSIWGVPPSGIYLSSSRVFNYAYVYVSTSKRNASPPPDLIKSAYSNSIVSSIIYAELGDVT